MNGEIIHAKKTFSPVKIYIENYSPSKINMHKLEPYLRTTTSYTDIFSSSGIYKIDKKSKKMCRIYPQDKPVIKFTNAVYTHLKRNGQEIEPVERIHIDQFKDTLLIDGSEFREEQVYSQIPYNHVANDYTSYSYTINKNKNPVVTLVVIGKPCMKMEEFTATNFFFLATEEHENFFVREELDQFLSILQER